MNTSEMPASFSCGMSSSGITPPPTTQHVVCALFLQQANHFWEQVHVCAGQRGQTDRVNVFLDRRRDDLLQGFGADPINNFHTSVAQSFCHDERATVMAIEAWFRDEYANFRFRHFCVPPLTIVPVIFAEHVAHHVADLTERSVDFDCVYDMWHQVIRAFCCCTQRQPALAPPAWLSRVCAVRPRRSDWICSRAGLIFCNSGFGSFSMRNLFTPTTTSSPDSIAFAFGTQRVGFHVYIGTGDAHADGWQDRALGCAAAAVVLGLVAPISAEENYAAWPLVAQRSPALPAMAS